MTLEGQKPQTMEMSEQMMAMSNEALGWVVKTMVEVLKNPRPSSKV